MSSIQFELFNWVLPKWYNSVYTNKFDYRYWSVFVLIFYYSIHLSALLCCLCSSSATLFALSHSLYGAVSIALPESMAVFRTMFLISTSWRSGPASTFVYFVCPSSGCADFTIILSPPESLCLVFYGIVQIGLCSTSTRFTGHELWILCTLSSPEIPFRKCFLHRQDRTWKIGFVEVKGQDRGEVIVELGVTT